MFTENQIQQVWDKTAIVAEGYDFSAIAKDCCGALILRSEYGNQDSPYGWEIDHVYPQSAGGDDNVINLRAMQWRNNRAKGDDFPVYRVAIQAQGNRNVEVEKQLKVNNSLYDRLRNLYKF